MRSASYITTRELSGLKANARRRNLQLVLVVALLFFTFVISVRPQTVAVLSPDPGPISALIPALSDDLADRIDVLDQSMVEAAFKASKHGDPYNMSSEEAKIAGSAIGCDFVLIVKTGNQRRTSSEREEYYESFAVFYVVSSRTGRLVHWMIRNAEEISQAEADSKLLAAIPTIARDLSMTIKDAQKPEIVKTGTTKLDEPPLPGTPEAKGFVAPIPFRRIKPEYTTKAYLYGVTATVEILVDLDAAGNITRTEIVRWAGYELDQSVDKAVRSMAWRPAERNKRPLPMRVLLRYNFKKADAKP